MDFDGQLFAAPIEKAIAGEGFSENLRGIDIGCGVLHYKFARSPMVTGDIAAAVEFHSSGALQIVSRPDADSVMGAIRLIQAEMRDGMSYLVNYCSQTAVASHYAPAELFTHSRAPYTIWLEGQFIAFSPESFITVEANQISTTPMKGTGFDAASLIADGKEQAEHATVVDLLRNDIGQVAQDVRVANYRYLSEIPQPGGRILYQTSTRITGELRSDWRERIGEWLPRLLPAGSISGAPKRETVALIRRYEKEPRGFFTGVALLFDGESLYSTVLIRFLDLRGERLVFRSGAGITIYSDPEAEYAEILSKVYVPL